MVDLSLVPVIVTFTFAAGFFVVPRGDDLDCFRMGSGLIMMVFAVLITMLSALHHFLAQPKVKAGEADR